MWTTLAAVAGGGALGAVLRYGIGLGIGRAAFPWATLTVNVTGSLLFGFLAIYLGERMPLAAGLRAFLLVGVLSGFTTFSTFSWETIALLENGEFEKALVNVVLNVIACLAAAACGIWIARQLI